MPDTWNGHVIGKVESPVPVEVSIENSGTKASGSILSAVSIDSFGAAQESFAIAEQMAVVVQVVDGDFKPSVPNPVEETLRHRVLPFRYDLERGFDPGSIVQIHQMRAEVPAA